MLVLVKTIMNPSRSLKFREFGNSEARGVWYCLRKMIVWGHTHPSVSGPCKCGAKGTINAYVQVKKRTQAEGGGLELRIKDGDFSFSVGGY